MSEKRKPTRSHESRAAALEALYREIHDHYQPRDPELLPRALIDGSLESRVLLLGQALAKATQRLSGIPYCFPPSTSPRLSNGGKVLDHFLERFGYTIDPRVDDRQYAHHTDLAHYFPGKKAKGFGDLMPSSADIRHDREWFEREVAIIRPTVVVALGKDPALEFARRYLGIHYNKLSDVPIDPIPAQLASLNLDFLAVHHPSGAYQHPSSKERYERVADSIADLLAG